MVNQPIRLLHDSLIQSAQNSPDKIVLVAEGKSYRYRELLHASLNIASYLRRNGLSNGDRVAIYMDNTWPCVISLYAILLAGGVFLMINPQTKSDKLLYIFNDSEASFLITEAHLKKFYHDVIPATSHLKYCICSNMKKEGESIYKNVPVVSFEEISFGGTSPVPLNPLHLSTISLDLAALIYTSGSTGNPKGVMMTHQSMVFAAQSLIQYLRLSANDRIMNLLPLAFDYGLYQLLMTVFLGATLVLERSFAYPAVILKRIKEFDVTVFPGVPTVFAMLVSMHHRKPLSLPSITRITNTAAALPSDYQSILHEIFPCALVYRMYGLTECKRVSYLEPELADLKPNSVGKAIPGTQVFLLSKEGNPVPPETPGILHVRGVHIMKGYWKQPELTRQMLKPGPLSGEYILCAQDWLKMDKDGDLYFLGRNDDIIKTRGEKVSPVEVENVLYGIPGIKETAVIGIPDDLFGQAVKAFVVVEEGSVFQERDILKICSVNLENFMVPKVIEFVNDLPKTTSGKISKKELH